VHYVANYKVCIDRFHLINLLSLLYIFGFNWKKEKEKEIKGNETEKFWIPKRERERIIKPMITCAIYKSKKCNGFQFIHTYLIPCFCYSC
jgi:hypothetical protein